MTAEIVPFAKASGGPAASIDAMLSLTASGMNAVNAVILDRMQSEIPLIPSLAGPRSIQYSVLFSPRSLCRNKGLVTF